MQQRKGNVYNHGGSFLVRTPWEGSWREEFRRTFLDKRRSSPLGSTSYERRMTDGGSQGHGFRARLSQECWRFVFLKSGASQSPVIDRVVFFAVLVLRWVCRFCVLFQMFKADFVFV